MKSFVQLCGFLRVSRAATTFEHPAVKQYSKQQVEEGVNIYTQRSHTCGELSSCDVGKHVSLCGWLEFRRMDKFGVIRDAYGTTQLIIPEERKDLITELSETPLESVVTVDGMVNKRPDSQVNEKMVTGDVEVVVSGFKVLNKVTKQLPFSLREFNKAKESLRMKYRYLDLRFPQMQRNLRMRSQILLGLRDFLINYRSFIEVETPTLFKRTPGGAQEYLVPTRFPGEFYSLVQSPQQLKQLLMVGGVDRYFQLARCYRDEGARPDRQPEFTQLDIELSFTNCEGVIALIEELLAHCWPSDEFITPFPRLKYREAIESYGTDKPDVRFEPKIQKVDDLLPKEDSSRTYMFPKTWKSITARALRIPRGSDHLRNEMKKKIEQLKHKKYAETWLSVFKVPDNLSVWQNTMESSRIPLDSEGVWNSLHLEPYDLLFLSIGEYDKVLEMLGQLRTMYFDSLMEVGLVEPSNQRFLWVLDFPLFFQSPEGSLVSAHHPFTRPHPADLHLLETNPLEVRGLHYDLVMDGCEIGGGSERIHEPELQKRILTKYLNIPTESLTHLLDALASGAPPHAGIALGIDRLVSLICGTSSIRDVMAFPKGSDGRDQMCGIPSHVSEEELAMYHLKVAKEKLKKKSVVN